MTDEQRLQMITEQLIIVRDNLFRGMSKSIQKLQARSINEVLELPNYMESPKREWIGLTDEEIGTPSEPIQPNEALMFARVIESLLKEKNQ